MLGIEPRSSNPPIKLSATELLPNPFVNQTQGLNKVQGHIQHIPVSLALEGLGLGDHGFLATPGPTVGPCLKNKMMGWGDGSVVKVLAFTSIPVKAWVVAA